MTPFVAVVTVALIATPAAQVPALGVGGTAAEQAT